MTGHATTATATTGPAAANSATSSNGLRRLLEVDVETERSKREVEAEAVASIVGCYCGLDSSRSAVDLAGWNLSTPRSFATGTNGSVARQRRSSRCSKTEPAPSWSHPTLGPTSSSLSGAFFSDRRGVAVHPSFSSSVTDHYPTAVLEETERVAVHHDHHVRSNGRRSQPVALAEDGIEIPRPGRWVVGEVGLPLVTAVEVLDRHQEPIRSLFSHDSTRPLRSLDSSLDGGRGRQRAPTIRCSSRPADERK